MSSGASALPVYDANITLGMTPYNVIDMNTLWLMAASGPIGFLSTAIADQTATSLVFTAAVAQNIVNESVVVDNEPMLVTALSSDGLTATVERWRTAFPFMEALPATPTDSHAANAPVMLLTYTTPFTYMTYKYVSPNFQQDVMSLGKKSATFGVKVSGTLSIASSGS